MRLVFGHAGWRGISSRSVVGQRRQSELERITDQSDQRRHQTHGEHERILPGVLGFAHGESEIHQEEERHDDDPDAGDHQIDSRGHRDENAHDGDCQETEHRDQQPAGHPLEADPVENLGDQSARGHDTGAACQHRENDANSRLGCDHCGDRTEARSAAEAEHAGGEENRLRRPALVLDFRHQHESEDEVGNRPDQRNDRRSDSGKKARQHDHDAHTGEGGDLAEDAGAGDRVIAGSVERSSHVASPFLRDLGLSGGCPQAHTSFTPKHHQNRSAAVSHTPLQARENVSEIGFLPCGLDVLCTGESC